MFATYSVKRHHPEGWFASKREAQTFPIDPRDGFGVLEMYICRGCGFTDWYCQDPENIPIGPEYMTEEVDVSGEEPHR